MQFIVVAWADGTNAHVGIYTILSFINNRTVDDGNVESVLATFERRFPASMQIYANASFVIHRQ